MLVKWQQGLNESICKACEEAREEEMHKKIGWMSIKAHYTINNQWAQKEATLKNELSAEKLARERDLKKN